MIRVRWRFEFAGGSSLLKVRVRLRFEFAGGLFIEHIKNQAALFVPRTLLFLPGKYPIEQTYQR